MAIHQTQETTASNPRGCRVVAIFTCMAVTTIVTMATTWVMPSAPVVSSLLWHPTISRADGRVVEKLTSPRASYHENASSLLSSNATHLQDQGPIQQLVFLKLHKTGSSTITSIIQRYGFENKLNFLVPSCGHILSTNEPFTAAKVQSPSSSASPTSWRPRNGRRESVDILTNHARYNRPEMNKYFRSAMYVTILREPAAQFESTYYYFEMYKFLPVRTGRNSLEQFFEDPERNTKVMRSQAPLATERRMHNSQLFDLGIDAAHAIDGEALDAMIRQLDRELDLVMLNERFDESLLLLKKIMRWSIDDILYVSRGIRRPEMRAEMTRDLRTKICAWNAADFQLYQYFNRTFWDKVRNYGPSFNEDLASFRAKQRTLKESCISSEDSPVNRRALGPVLKADAPDWCLHFVRNDVDFTTLIRKRMKKEGVPLYMTCDKMKSA